MVTLCGGLTRNAGSRWNHRIIAAGDVLTPSAGAERQALAWARTLRWAPMKSLVAASTPFRLAVRLGTAPCEVAEGAVGSSG